MRRSNLTVRSIARAVSAYYRIGWNDLASPRRTSNIVRARQVLIFLAREHTTLSLPQIGRRVGGRDHTTVLHSCRKIAFLRDADPELRQELREIEEMIYEQEAAHAHYQLAPEPDTDPFEIADRIMEVPSGEWRLTASEIKTLAEAVIMRRPIEEEDPDPVEIKPIVAVPARVENVAQRTAPPVPAVPMPRAPIPMPIQRVLKAYRSFENARFSPRELGEREAFERTLNELSTHLNRENNHVRH